MSPGMPHVEGVEHRYAEVDGVRIHYAEAGSGEPVVLQHGWPEHWYAWRNQIGPLAERYRVICPDLRGFGWSDAPPSGYEKAQLARDLIGLLDALGIERVRYAGHDWGAFAGYLACFDHPERFERFVPMAVGPPWREGRPPLILLLFLTYQLVVSAPVIGSFVMRRGFSDRIFRASRKAGKFTDDEIRIYRQQFESPEHANASVQMYRTFLTRELAPIARGKFNDRRLTVPTLQLMGGSDPLLKSLDRELIARNADDLRVEVVDGASHWLHEEKPEETTRHLLDFFA